MTEKKQIIIIPILVGLTTLIFVCAGVFFGWFGMEREGIMLFCEHARAGLIKQPSNTISNLGFMISGIYIAWLFYKTDFKVKNNMTTNIFYPIFFSSVIVFVGPGSMAMHASNAYWGGFIDLFSMFLFSAFLFTYGFVRLVKFGRTAFILIYTANILVCSAIYLSPYNVIDFPLKLSEFCFAANLIGATIFELYHHYILGNKIKPAWGWLTIFIFFVAFAIWILSRTQESLFCDPHSLVQGHAMWHLLNAIAAYFLFLFYTSEETGESLKTK